MASNLNNSDANKKNKSSTNENNFNNKNFNHQKNQKSRNIQSKAFTNDKSTMDSNNTNTTKVSNESGDKNAKNSQEKSNLSDEDRCWKFRPPPRGFTSETYVLCQNFIENGICNFGLNCVNAHSPDELQEWKDRFEYRKTQHENSIKLQYGKSYTEELLERLHQSTNPEKIMKEKIEGIEVTCSNELNLTVSSKTCKREWIFVLKTSKLLKAVALLQDEHRTHFAIKHVFPMHPSKQCNQAENNKNMTTDQEWTFPLNVDVTKDLDTDNEIVVSHRVKIGFSTDIYGTFRQAVCFEFFGTDTILVRHFCIDVVPLEEYDKIQEIKNDILTVTRTRWNSSNSNLVPYKSPAQPFNIYHSAQAYDSEKELELLDKYPCPQADTFVLSQSTINGRLSEHNYQQWMHTLLYIEEMARFDLIAKFNLTTNLKITNNFILAPNGMATSTAKYSHSGELFGVLELSQNISEDTPPGYLILNNCNSLFFTKTVSSQSSNKSDTKPEVYEALIEDKSKNVIYLKLSADTVKTIGLKNDDVIKVDIQFQPNRLTYCEWHLAIDKITNYKILFPDTNIDPDIHWNPKRQWDASLDQKLNSKQKEAVVTITSPINKPLPPILLIGPYGTGKTYTLAQIIKQLLSQSEARILICTHSNSAADLYIREYLHPWVEGGLEDAKPLRIYYHKRWVATVNPVVQKYCLIEMKGNARVFKKPTVEDVYSHKIVVVTLSTSMELASLNLKKGYFTHILLDEAAQALECEAITPIALADTNTRIVLAGDHMQMSPEIFSNFARERKLHISLLERLYEHYPTTFPTKILLCENYRAHEAIIKFTSELFYDQKLIASGKQPRHEKFYPLTFFTSRGEDVQDKNSTAFYNNSEVYEIVDRVCELKRKWPAAWGKFNDQSIGIMTPYADQVFRIRSELRKKRLAGISVERVLNVQGKQFRAVFLSTVRTRKTCSNKSEDIDYGFLSNSKLLNTAITRAQSLVSVVGDPVALCSVGRCRKVWERFIEICHQNKSLFGITWQMLKSQLDGLEMRKTYVLNPLAPEFIPRALQSESYLRDQMMMMNPRKFGNMMPLHPPQIQSHPMNFHHQQQSQMPPHPSFHPSHIPSQQHNMMMNHFPPPQTSSQASAAPAAPQFNNNNMMNQTIRPFGSPSFPMHPPPPTNSQFSPYNSTVPFPSYNQNFNQPNTMGPPSMMPNFHMNTNNMWNSSASPMFQQPQQPVGGIVEKPTQGPWQMKPPMLSQQSPHQVRPPLGPPHPSQIRPTPQIPQHPNQIFPPHYQQPPQQQQQQQQQPQTPQIHNMNMNSYPTAAAATNLPKYSQNPINDMNSFNGNHGNVDFNMLTNSTSKMTLNDMILHPDLLENLKKTDKEVQFLQNVHFPEKNASGIQQQTPQQAFNKGLSGSYASYSHLLPPNMSVFDMYNKSREFQYNWFTKLSELYGLEEAGRFVELLRQVPQMANANNTNNNNMMNNMKTVNAIESMQLNGVDDPSKNYLHLMDLQASKANESKYDNFLKIPNSSGFGNDVTNNKMFQSEEIDTIFMNSVQNQNQKASYETLLVTKEVDVKQNQNVGILGSLFQQPSTSSASVPSNFVDRNILNGIDIFNIPAKSIDLDDTNVQSPQRSVPLYMRASKNTK